MRHLRAFLRGHCLYAACSLIHVPSCDFFDRIMTAEAASSLAAVAEKRHITIGWHQMGKAADAIKYILKFSLGQYRNS